MNNGFFTSLIYNTSLLLVLVALYSGIALKASRRSRLKDSFTGILIGAISIAIMSNPWILQPGITFDVRSVLLSVTGLFFGLLPTLWAVAITAVYRIYLGGAGMWMGLGVIITSAGLGLLWQRWRPDARKKRSLPELYIFGLCVHLLMLACAVFLPWPGALEVLGRIAGPVLGFYPVGTLLLGFLLIQQRENLQLDDTLNESKKLLETIVENVPLMIFLKEAADLRFVVFNRAGEELLGYDRKDLLGKNNLDLFPAEQAAHFMAKDREVLDGGMGVLDIPEEYILTAKKGQRVLHTRKVCLKGPDGAPKYLLGISEDITDRKHAENEKAGLETRLLQSQKMEAVGRLAGGVAHDFNNILTAIKCYGELILGGFSPGDPRRADAQEILDSADRAASLTRQLLAFSRRQIMAPRVADLNKIIGDMTNMLRRLIGEDIKLETRLHSAPCLAKVDSGQLEQVIVNLVVNSRDAMSKGGSITLETEIILAPEEVLFTAHPDLRRGPLVRLTARDTGCGMTPEARTHAFEPFFTTKPVGKGTGLGLSTIFGIIKQSGGEIELGSEEGKGTAFYIYLPLAPAGERDLEKHGGSTSPLHGSETVLLVEDEATLLRLGERMLRAHGYKVLTAANGAAALEAVARHGQPVDLLLTDVVMPGMSGRELALELARQKLSGRTLYMSGYTDDAIVKHGVLEPGLAFIYKPFTVEGLLSKMREVLDGPADQAKA